MVLLVILAVGGVIGWWASVLARADAQLGVKENVTVGCLGALLGNVVAAALGLAHDPIVVYLASVAGAVVLVVLLRAVGVFRRRADSP